MITLIKDWLFSPLAWPLIAALGLSGLSGPLGCLLIWQRLAFMGDALGHVALLGAALALVWETPFWLGGVLVSFVFSLFYVGARFGRKQPEDAVLAWLTQTALAMSALLFSFLPQKVSVSALLFGAWGHWTPLDLMGIWILVIVGGITLFFYFPLIMRLIVDPDALSLAGYQPFWIQFWVIWFSALMVAFAMKMVGALLCAALLVIPQMTARLIARSPEGMMWRSSLLALLAMGGGAGLAARQHWPVGPTIVLVGNLLFLVVHCYLFCRRKIRSAATV